MDASGIPILLTSSVVAHDPGVRLRDRNERLRLALESVAAWREIAPQNPLVLCDGSGFDFTPTIERWSLHQAPIECLAFANNPDLVRTHGRGYGEGEIVRHALEHSRLIQHAGCFAKCTSKLWVENFSECIQSWNGRLLLKGVFGNAFSLTDSTVFSYIDTRFYVASIEVFRTHFLNAHTLIRADQGYGLEDCFRDVFLQSNLHHCLMSPPPVICGMGGGTGKYYKNTLLRRQKERLRYFLIKNKKEFNSWFTDPSRDH